MRCLIFFIFLICQCLFALENDQENLFTSNYPQYISTNFNRTNLWYFMECQDMGVYLKEEFLKHIDKNQVNSIIEIGSRDLKDAYDLSEYYKCHVFAFECNPDCLAGPCRENDRRLSNVTLVEMAVWNTNGLIVFFPTMYAPDKMSNPGFSSCFPMIPYHLNFYKQSVISVLATRLDTWLEEQDFESIDLLCISANGASLQVLQSMGSYLCKTKYIIAEHEINPRYQNSCSFPELIKYLTDNGFKIVFTEVENNFLFINTKLVEK